MLSLEQKTALSDSDAIALQGAGGTGSPSGCGQRPRKKQKVARRICPPADSRAGAAYCGPSGAQ